MTTVALSPGFGTGILSFPAVAKLIDRPTATVRRWVSEGLVAPSYGRGSAGSDVLSFHDVVSLEVIRRLREAGVSLQRVRALEVALREAFAAIARPFAHRALFTDGAAVWVSLDPDGDAAIELVGRRKDQLAWLPPIATFAEQIEFDATGAAQLWNIAEHIVVDPNRQFGSPVIQGTRVPVLAVKQALEEESEEQVARGYGIPVAAVRAAAAFRGV